MRTFPIVALVRLVVVGTFALWAARFTAVPAQSGPARLIVRNVTLIDATNGVRPAMDVEISGGLLRRVAPAAAHPSARKIGSVDGKGKYLIPGLRDMHVHSFWTKHLSVGRRSLKGQGT